MNYARRTAKLSSYTPPILRLSFTLATRAIDSINTCLKERILSVAELQKEKSKKDLNWLFQDLEMKIIELA